jgi:hypothetical protein
MNNKEFRSMFLPQGIRSRDLTTLPPKEFKTPGPKYGTTLGQGLNVGTVSKLQARIPILKCPSKLELRQLIQYKPVSNQLVLQCMVLKW